MRSDGVFELKVAHHHPGRLRLRSRALEGDHGAATAADAVAAIREIAGVAECVTSSRTGSVLITYDPRLVGPDTIIDAASRRTGIALGSGRAKLGDEDRLAYIAIDVAREVNTLVQELTHHRADLRVLVPLALAGLSAVSLAERGARLPSWDNLLYWSYSIFMAVNEREIHEDRSP
jgi:hypothetical protein